MGKAKTEKGKGKKGKNAKPLKTVNGKPDPILANAAAIGLEILTLEEAAALLRVSVEGLRADAEKGTIPARWIGGEWRFFTHAIHSWLTYPQVRRYTADEIANAPVVLPDRIVKAMPRESPTMNADQLSTIGSMADDDTLPAMVDEIYRRRAEEE